MITISASRLWVGAAAIIALAAVACSGSSASGGSSSVRLRFGAISGAMDPSAKGPAAPSRAPRRAAP